MSQTKKLLSVNILVATSISLLEAYFTFMYYFLVETLSRYCVLIFKVIVMFFLKQVQLCSKLFCISSSKSIGILMDLSQPEQSGCNPALCQAVNKSELPWHRFIKCILNTYFILSFTVFSVYLCFSRSLLFFLPFILKYILSLEHCLACRLSIEFLFIIYISCIV